MTDEKMVKGYRKSLRQMTDSLYHKHLESIKLASISPTDLVDMLRERDKRIEKLENANTKISAECHKLVDSLEQKQNRIKELEKHNEEIIALIHAERERQEKCDDVHLRKIADLEKENAEMLKRFNRLTEITDDKNKLLDVISNYEVKVADLEQKNADLKEEIDDIAFARGELEQENESLENVKNIYIGDLIKARKIIKDYMIVATSGHTTVCSVPEENRCINVLKLNEQAEQFLKEINK